MISAIWETILLIFKPLFSKRAFTVNMVLLYLFNFSAFLELTQALISQWIMGKLVQFILFILKTMYRTVVGGNRQSLLASWRMNLHPAVPLTDSQFKDILSFKCPTHFKQRCTEVQQ